MGQQQFLLISLTVIIVALMVAVSIAMFMDQAAATNRDALSNDLVMYASKAQEFYRQPTMLGGGGGSFISFSLGNDPKTADGVFDISAVAPNSIDIEGVGVELGYDQVNPVKLVIKVTADSVKVVEVN